MSLVIHRRRRNEINIIPLIDVMVVLVFFLLLCGRFEEANSLAIVPPAAQSGAAGNGGPAIVVGIDRDGKIYLEGKEVTRPVLEKAMADRAKRDANAEVLIVADEQSLTGAAVYVLDTVGKVGLKPRLLTRKPQ
jgi:biopolymer transport protein ExbD